MFRMVRKVLLMVLRMFAPLVGWLLIAERRPVSATPTVPHYGARVVGLVKTMVKREVELHKNVRDFGSW